jgi:hypothetical protein
MIVCPKKELEQHSLSIGFILASPTRPFDLCLTTIVTEVKNPGNFIQRIGDRANLAADSEF